MTDEIEFRARTPEERQRAEQELSDLENSDPNICFGCGS